MVEDIELTEKERQNILEAREKAKQEAIEQQKRKDELLKKYKDTVASTKRRKEQSLTRQYENTIEAFEVMKKELAKSGNENLVSMEVKSKVDEDVYCTHNRDLWTIPYKVSYREATITLKYQRWHSYYGKIKNFTTTVLVKHGKCKCRSIVGTDRMVNADTLAKKLVETNARAIEVDRAEKSKKSKLDNLLEDTKIKYLGHPNIVSIEQEDYYRPRASALPSVCITFKSGSKIYLGYRYEFQTEYDVLHVDDALKYKRDEDAWVELFSKQEKND